MLHNQKKLPLIMALLIFVGQILTRYSFLDLPLKGDEWYYASPGILEGISNWVNISFGHPPAWNFLNGVFYYIFGFSPIIAHWIGLICSSLSLAALFFMAQKTWSTSIAMLVITGVYTQSYFMSSSSFNQPVILSASCGLLSLFFLKSSRYLTYSLLTTAAVLLRESSLVFVIAGILMMRDKKTLKSSIFPILALSFFYFWHYLATGKMLLNNQKALELSQSKPILYFNLNHIVSFYWEYFLPYIHAFVLILLVLGLFMLLFKFKRFYDPMLVGLSTVVVLHSSFFAMYVDRAQRNTFIGSLALIFMLGPLLNKLRSGKEYLHYITAPLCCYLVYQSLVHIHSPYFGLNRFKDEVVMIRRLDQHIRSHQKNSSNLDILTTNPYVAYLNDSNMGFVEQENHIRWHGGVPGRRKLGEPDLILVPMNYHDNWATRELKSLALSQSKYELDKSIKNTDESKILNVYIRK